MSKRQIKKRILAEALKVFREHQFETKSFVIDQQGKLLRVELRSPFDRFTDLAHEVARFDGERP